MTYQVYKKDLIGDMEHGLFFIYCECRKYKMVAVFLANGTTLDAEASKIVRRGGKGFM